jgi:hypothetical protein
MIYWMSLCGIGDIEEIATNYLQEMLLQIFDPQKADRLFQQTNDVGHMHEEMMLMYTLLIDSPLSLLSF